jgi:hypothetical protein
MKNKTIGLLPYVCLAIGSLILGLNAYYNHTKLQELIWPTLILSSCAITVGVISYRNKLAGMVPPGDPIEEHRTATRIRLEEVMPSQPSPQSAPQAQLPELMYVVETEYARYVVKASETATMHVGDRAHFIFYLHSRMVGSIPADQVTIVYSQEHVTRMSPQNLPAPEQPARRVRGGGLDYAQNASVGANLMGATAGISRTSGPSMAYPQGDQ